MPPEERRRAGAALPGSGNAGGPAATGSVAPPSSKEASAPIVYTVAGCDACVRLLKMWNAGGVSYEERRVDLSQATLDEARCYGSLVPIVVWPDGRVEQGFGDSLGCFI